MLYYTKTFTKTKNSMFMKGGVMNKQELDVLNCLLEAPYVNQRMLSELSHHSLEIVNKALKQLSIEEYIDKDMLPMEKARQLLNQNAPKNAIILAAGTGMRMIPINTQMPKALLEINGETLIERIIKQLHEQGIREIYIVVGFMKESFEYLIDEYDVELIVNSEYESKNNLHSLNLVADKISNSYIIPCDVWFTENPFRKNELYSWYMISDELLPDSQVRCTRKWELVQDIKTEKGNAMVGVAYIEGEKSRIVRERLAEYDNNSKYNTSFWEEVLYDDNRMMVHAKLISKENVVEINTYEQLREMDQNSNHLKTDAINIIQEALGVSINEIVDITALKKGMTNRSFLFRCRDEKYIMRIPGEGTQNLINRENEAEVYQMIKNMGLCDDLIYINPQNGYKITRFMEKVRVCNAKDEEDVQRCIFKLRDFHNKKLQVNHEFDIFEQISFYESLWNNGNSIFKDYQRTKQNVLSLKPYIAIHREEKCLTHIDAIPDNFLISSDGESYLIDWEYAGMQDPHVDLAMFCIYSFYNRDQIDKLIDLYFDGKCKREVRIKIYCYIAACGLLWSNWCEYKRSLGIEFGEYSLRQYRYAKEYYQIAINEMKGNSE